MAQPILPIARPYRRMLVTVSCQTACYDKNNQQALIKMHALGCENSSAKGATAFNYL
jgi:hypothetical protein